MRSLVLALIFSCTVLSGCASVPEDQDEQGRLAVASKSLGKDFKFAYVPSDGFIADSAFVSSSKSSGPSGMARQLALELAKGRNSHYKLAVSGPSSAKTIQIIKDAFGLLNGSKVSELEFAYIGDESDKEEIKSIVESAGAAFVFVSY